MINNFKELTRSYSLPVTITPFLIAFACALKTPFIVDSSFIGNSILILIAIILVHLSSNLFDDYIDVKKELEKGVELSSINFRNKQKARLILNKTFSFKSVEKILFVMMSLAFIIGLYFVSIRGYLIFSYMILTVILSSIYPYSAKFGLSEIIIGTIFGPLLINGTYFALSGQFDSQVFIFSIASAIITTILLIVHSLMDYEFDVEVGKKSIPVMLKNKNLTINFISIMILISYGLLVFVCLKYQASKLILIPILFTLPIAIKLISSLYDYIQIKNVSFIPKWFYGPMENWDIILKNNFAYFMFRFYLARNLSSIFNIVLSIVCILAFVPIKTFEFRGLQFILNHYIF